MQKMFNETCRFILNKYPTESEEQLKHVIYQVAYKFLNDPQLPKYLKQKPKKKTSSRKNNEQTGPLVIALVKLERWYRTQK